MSAEADRSALLEAVKQGIEAAPANSAKWKPLKDWFRDRFGTEAIPDKRAAEGKNITAEKQVWNRIHNELAGRDPRYAVITAVDGGLLPHIKKHLASTQYPRARAFLLLDGLDPYELQVYQADAVTAALEEMFPDLTPVPMARPEHRASPMEPGEDSEDDEARGLTMPTMVPISVDDRVRRMVQLSIRSSRAVILVGPPGTGKTTLLKDTVSSIGREPRRHGFSKVNEPIIATPEESWTTMDLLGGQTLSENGTLRFRPGLVLESIVEDRWLILDEANRADLDRIFGGLLTWLSINADVDLGPVTTHVSSDRVVLGWADEGESSVENLEALDADEPTGEDVRYLAGDQWRLLGTYNAADAQRVFRWGQALGRRFARVPVSAPGPAAFSKVLEPLTIDLSESVQAGIVNLYSAHHEQGAAQLGPAPFMQIPRYVEQGLIGNDSTDALVSELLAEGYLITIGTTLSKLRPEDLAALHDAVVNQRKVFDEEQWEWIIDQAAMLG